MKRIIFTVLWVVIGGVLCMFDSVEFGVFLSLSLAVCLSLFGGIPFVTVCTVFGMFMDFLNYSLPFYAFIYLYISLGCVWIKGFLFKTNFIICFFFWFVSIVFTCLISGEFSLLGCVLNSLSFFVFYVILKGAKFEKNSKI